MTGVQTCASDLAIGGQSLTYITYGPRPLPQPNPELNKIFTYNDAGISEYHPPAVELATPDAEAETAVMSSLAGLPVAEAAPLAAEAAPMAMRPIAAPTDMRAAPAPSGLQGDVWRERVAANAPISAKSAEERSLAAMFNMLAGKTHGHAPDAATPATPQAPQSDNGDLFRRL